MSYTKEKKVVIILCFTIFIVLWLLYELFVGCFRKYEYKTDLTSTNTTPSIYDTDEDLMSDLEENYRYFAEYLNNNKTTKMYVIPGMTMTKSLSIKTSKKADCTSMTPQGLAVTEKYIFISAYCYTHKHHSVLYVLDRASGNFIKEIVLDSTSHVGGLAFDENYNKLWVAEYKNSKSYVGSLKLEDIENYDINGNRKLEYTDFIRLKGIKRASFITYNNNSLLVGYFNLFKSGYFKVFDIDEKGTINGNTNITRKIDRKIQGMAYDNNTLYLSQSFSFSNSKLIMFDKVSDIKNNSNYYEYDAKYSISLPEKLEQIYVYDNNLYMLFESSAFGYKFTSNNHIDRIISFSLDDKEVK